MVGNGVCDTVFDGNALVPFAHGMALISDDMYKVCHQCNCTPDRNAHFEIISLTTPPIFSDGINISFVYFE